jgi:YesN/AraC family two-component response regulator
MLSSCDEKDTMVNRIIEFIFLLRLLLSRIGFNIDRTEFIVLADELLKAEDISKLTVLAEEIISEELSVCFDDIKTIANRKYHKILNYTNVHIFDYNLSLDILAEKGNCTPQYVCKIFKECLNKTFNNYITEKRIGMAMHLLLSTDETISDISGKVGYLDQNYFCRIFKKKTGYRPNECRQ